MRPATLSVALLQLRSPGADPVRSLAVGEQACREAARRGADVALFPELWQLGYDLPAIEEAGWEALATDADGSFVEHFRRLASELRMAIVVTYLERWAGGPRNAATLIDRHGRDVLTYAKVHTCAFAEERAMTPGDAFPTAELELASGSIRVGLMICFDREFPESARALALGGAEVILTPNACPLANERAGQFRARCFENMVGAALANYAAPADARSDDHEAFDGRSMAYSGICFAADGAPLDQTLVQAGPDEGIVLATFDLDALREYRRREVWVQHRRPRTYGALVVARTAGPSTCEACGASFGCGAGTGSCWCREQDVPTEVLAELRDRFESCLCERCLALAAAGEVPTRLVPVRSGPPPAASPPSAS
jgi:N-carbamoylputrescine amidase